MGHVGEDRPEGEKGVSEQSGETMACFGNHREFGNGRREGGEGDRK